MSNKMADVTLHIDENTSHDERESLRDNFLVLHGVMAAAYHDTQPHLMIIESISSGSYSYVKTTLLNPSNTQVPNAMFLINLALISFRKNPSF